jgi:hypothetical protein
VSNKIKGNILEDLVALMHEVPGVVVEKRGSCLLSAATKHESGRWTF